MPLPREAPPQSPPTEARAPRAASSLHIWAPMHSTWVTPILALASPLGLPRAGLQSSLSQLLWPPSLTPQPRCHVPTAPHKLCHHGATIAGHMPVHPTLAWGGWPCTWEWLSTHCTGLGEALQPVLGPPSLPSFHSLVAGLMMPKSSSQVTALGSRSTATGFLFRF